MPGNQGSKQQHQRRWYARQANEKASDPHRLTKEEEIVIEKIRQSFLNSEKLQKHIAFLFSKGGMYLVYNNNLLCHGCIPMTSETEFKKFNVKGKEVYGKESAGFVVVAQGLRQREGRRDQV